MISVVGAVAAVARWRRGKALKLRPNCAAVDWLGVIPPAHLAMKDKPFQ